MTTTNGHNIELATRELIGKKVNTLRRQGIVPVHVYGTDKEPQTLQVEAHTLRRVLPRVGTNIPLTVSVEGESGETICFVREVQRHPVTEELLHVDFMRVQSDRRIRSQVPILAEGTSPAIRDEGGTLVQQMTTVEVESLPLEVPASIIVDISVLEDFESSIHVRDLIVGPNVEMISDPEAMVCRALPPRKAEEFELLAEAAALEAAEGEEGEEGAEGEGPADEAEGGSESASEG